MWPLGSWSKVPGGSGGRGLGNPDWPHGPRGWHPAVRDSPHPGGGYAVAAGGAGGSRALGGEGQECAAWASGPVRSPGPGPTCGVTPRLGSHVRARRGHQSAVRPLSALSQAKHRGACRGDRETGGGEQGLQGPQRASRPPCQNRTPIRPRASSSRPPGAAGTEGREPAEPHARTGASNGFRTTPARVSKPQGRAWRRRDTGTVKVWLAEPEE